MNSFKFAVDGMHCRSCELTIERKLKKLPGVASVDVNVAKGVARVNCEGQPPSIETLNASVSKDGYAVRPLSEGAKPDPAAALSEGRPSLWQLVGLFALVLILGRIVTNLGWLKTGFAIDGTTGFWAVFIVGLIAAASSCIAVSGGLMLTAAAKYNERFGTEVSPSRKMLPVVLFVGGRVTSYTVLGGVIGFLGKALAPSSSVTGSITVLAALYMLIMGLDMLHLAPTWLKGLLPRMPKSLSHRILDAEGHPHPAAPFLLGGATFFIPCGFTQALQLYALTTGSFTRSAMLLFAFALGTAPALLALGWASSSLKGKAGRFFFRFSGALVVVLGLWNIQNGLTITGHPLTWPAFSSPAAASAEAQNDANVTTEGATQVLKMGFDSSGYVPDRFTLKAGAPARWEIDGTKAAGCQSVIQVPQLGIRKSLARGPNIIDFTAPAPGDYLFTCSMGMYRGTFHVIPNA